MTQEQIEHWKLIVRAVFQAEHNLYDELNPKLHSKEITPDEYVEAIAKEILSKTYKNNETNQRKNQKTE